MRPAGAPLHFVQCASAHDERVQIGDMVVRATSHYKPNEVAVLCRTNKLLEAVEAELLQRCIPHDVVGKTGFFERREIRHLMSYAHLALGDDLYYILDIVNAPQRGLDKKAVDTLRGDAPEVTLPMLRDIEAIQGKVSLEAAKCAQALWLSLEQLRQAQKTGCKPVALLDLILGDVCNYASCLSKDRQEMTKQDDRIQQLRQFAAGFDSVTAFVEAVDELGGESPFAAPQAGVQLMTLHAAKGLEFPVVIIPGMEDGILPHYRTLTSDTELAAERRLLVMAMTRAGDHLIFTQARERDGAKTESSRFAREFERNLFELRGSPAFEREQKGGQDG
ncbi:MAG: hypothetical protein HC853_00115 [Anaerolineae bacterium]|nr:hypothetical protein [Anaerolineae bacterium]